MTVLVNDTPVEHLDSSGRFYSAVELTPGRNSFVVTAVDQAGYVATAQVSLIGLLPEDQADTRLTDLTSTLAADWGRTSLNQQTKILNADLRVRNDGSFPVDAPLRVVVRSLSHPNAAVAAPDGYTPDGLPYFDFSAHMGSALAPGALTSARTLTFYDPDEVPFTVELLFLGHVNESPEFTVVPGLEALTERPYVGQMAATDPDGDPVTLQLVSGPAGMTLVAGQLLWTPPAGDVGVHEVLVRASDGRGGQAELRFGLTVQLIPPNRPPVFTSTPPAGASVHAAWTYAPTATDADGDLLTFALVGPPVGASYDPATGLVSWTPNADQAGTQTLIVEVTDPWGGSARQSIVVSVQPEIGTSAPFVVSSPVNPRVLAGQTFVYTARASDADGDALTWSAVEPAGLTVHPTLGAVHRTAQGGDRLLGGQLRLVGQLGREIRDLV